MPGPETIGLGTVDAVVFGSDQGMVGQFNEVVVESVIKGQAGAAARHRIWAIGERAYARLSAGELLLYYNRPLAGAAYAAVGQRVLPLDAAWSRRLLDTPWPTHNLPEVIGHGTTTLRALIREYLFISLFRACAESLASENASRLAAMERADRNIDQLLTNLQRSSIDCARAISTRSCSM